MKIKIIMLIILMLVSFNNVNCETDTYSIEYNYDNSKTITDATYACQAPAGIYILDINTITDVSFFGCYVPLSSWCGGTQASNFSYADLYSNSAKTNYIGRGIIGYIKDGVSGYRMQLHILSLNWGGLSGTQGIFWIPDTSLDTMAVNKHGGGPSGFNGHGIWSARPALDRRLGGGCIHTTKIKYQFYNDIEYFYNQTYDFFELTIFRNSTYLSKWYVNDSYTLWQNETTLQTNSESVYSYDIDNCTWDTHVTTDNDDIINLEIDFCSLMGVPDLTQPTLITDKTTYNTSEQITINYTNIQKIYDECDNTLCEKGYYISILTISDDESYDYDKKHETCIPFYYTESGGTKVFEDGSFTINTSFLYPETDYVLGLCGYYGNTRLKDENLLYSKNFYVYPANEYLSISCDDETECFIYQGEKLNIYYKINNNSNIIIKDHDNNIINTYYNIIGTGTLIYNIPDDVQHLLSYPNWKIYLNNTDYTTSFNRGFTVYWSQFATPTPTPTPYPTATPDINISDQLDNLTVEIQPLKELLYGFVYIVIDNPDYDKDNIINENEINHWFNSLIPMCLFLLLVILYIGLKKNRD